MKTADVKVITRAIREWFGRVRTEASTKCYFKQPGSLASEIERVTLDCSRGEIGWDYDQFDLWPIRAVPAEQWNKELCDASRENGVAKLDLYLYSIPGPDGFPESELIDYATAVWEHGQLARVVVCCGLKVVPIWERKEASDE